MGLTDTAPTGLTQRSRGLTQHGGHSHGRPRLATALPPAPSALRLRASLPTLHWPPGLTAPQGRAGSGAQRFREASLEPPASTGIRSGTQAPWSCKPHRRKANGGLLGVGKGRGPGEEKQPTPPARKTSGGSRKKQCSRHTRRWDGRAGQAQGSWGIRGPRPT